jgi:altronate dehydratase
MPFYQWGETLTGIGAAGVDLIVLLTSEQPLPAHPMIPVLQVATDNAVVAIGQSDYDLNLGDDVATTASQLLDKIVAVLSRHYVPRQNAQANVDFQITRGFKGVSF